MNWSNWCFKFKKKKAGDIFCDLEKTFDSVHHNILLSKLEFCGIRGKLKELVLTYLTNRYQRVIVTSKNSYLNCFSKWEKIKCAVSQGSMLGLLLFLFYINDLTMIVINNSKPVFLADDTSIFVTHSNHIDFNT